MEKLEKLVHIAQEMYRTGLVKGTSGNVSMRDPENYDRMWITPSAIPYHKITTKNLVEVDIRNNKVLNEGGYKPSSETPMHSSIYRLRSDVCAIVHTHSTYATMFACAGEEIPAIHYLIADIGDRIPVADYAIYGSEELAEKVVSTLQSTGSNGVLMKNHGVITVGETLDSAYTRAEIIEHVAQLAFGAKLMGSCQTLTPKQLEETRQKFVSYFAVAKDMR